MVRGREGAVQSSGMLGVMGNVIMRGKQIQNSWVLLNMSAAKGDVSIVLDRSVAWEVGQEIAIRWPLFARLYVCIHVKI